MPAAWEDVGNRITPRDARWGRGHTAQDRGTETSTVWSQGHPLLVRLSPAPGTRRESWKRAQKKVGGRSGQGPVPYWSRAGFLVGPAGKPRQTSCGQMCAGQTNWGGLGEGPVICELWGPQGCPQKVETQVLVERSLPASLRRASLPPWLSRGLCRLHGRDPATLQPPSTQRATCFSLPRWQWHLTVSLSWAVKMFISSQV